MNSENSNGTKHRSRATCLSLALTLAAVASSGAQSWETVLEINPGFNRPNALFADPFTTDATPGLFIGGTPTLYLDQASSPPAVTVLENSGGLVYDFSLSPNGLLFNVKSPWTVARSVDGGITWSAVDDAALWAGKDSAGGYGIAVDGAGTVYANGRLSKKSGDFWVIRRGLNGGTSWQTVYTSAKAYAVGGGIEYVPAVQRKHNGGVFAVGSLTPGSYTQWVVLRSRDSGSTWSAVDTWTPVKNVGAAAKVIASTPQGAIYVAGYDSGGWAVRKSEDGGNSWTSILTGFSSGATNVSEVPSSITSDPQGNIYLTGLFYRNGKAISTVRRWDPIGGWDNWPDSLRYPLALQAEAARSWSITSDSLGNIYIGSTADSRWGCPSSEASMKNNGAFCFRNWSGRYASRRESAVSQRLKQWEAKLLHSPCKDL